MCRKFNKQFWFTFRDISNQVILYEHLFCEKISSFEHVNNLKHQRYENNDTLNLSSPTYNIFAMNVSENDFVCFQECMQ